MEEPYIWGVSSETKYHTWQLAKLKGPYYFDKDWDSDGINAWLSELFSHVFNYLTAHFADQIYPGQYFWHLLVKDHQKLYPAHSEVTGQDLIRYKGNHAMASQKLTLFFSILVQVLFLYHSNNKLFILGLNFTIPAKVYESKWVITSIHTTYQQ